MPKRSVFIGADDIVYCDPLQFSGAASHGGSGMLSHLNAPRSVQKQLLAGGKIYRDLMSVMWAVYPNNTGGLLIMRTPKKRVECILFFVVNPGEGQFLPGLFKYEGPISFISKVYWTRKRPGSLLNRLKLKGLSRKAVTFGGGADRNRVSRKDFMVTEEETGERHLGCINFFDSHGLTTEDVCIRAQIDSLRGGWEQNNYRAATEEEALGVQIADVGAGWEQGEYWAE